MFDIGFFELAMVFIVALLVIGPDRLPGLARTAGLWIGKGQAMIRSVKADIDRELDVSQAKEPLVKDTELNDLFADVKSVADEARCNFRLDASGQLDPISAPQQETTDSPQGEKA